MKEWGSTGWAALKDALKVVAEASGALPPLKMAIVGLLAVMEHIDVRGALQIRDENKLTDAHEVENRRCEDGSLRDREQDHGACDGYRTISECQIRLTGCRS